MSLRRKINFVILHIFLIGLTIVSLIPFIWMVGTSFKSEQEIFVGGINPFPHLPTLENYLLVIDRSPILTYYTNTFIVAFLISVVLVTVSVLAAYGFTRFNFWGRDIFYYFLLTSMFIPLHVRMIPNYLLVSRLDWLNTFPGLIVPQLANALGIFFLRQGMRAIPRSLFEASILDGAGHLLTLRAVLLPLLRPSLIALAVMFFINAWNEYYWPLLVVSDRYMFTLPLFLRMYMSEEGGTAWGAMMAASTLTALPPLVMYVFTQRFIIDSYVKSGIRG